MENRMNGNPSLNIFCSPAVLKYNLRLAQGMYLLRTATSVFVDL
jgi:hypothetical protein